MSACYKKDYQVAQNVRREHTKMYYVLYTITQCHALSPASIIKLYKERRMPLASQC